MSFVTDNYRRVCDRIADAAAKSGRRFEDITVVTVTKTVDFPLIEEAIAAGATDLAENRVQEYVRKRDAVDERINWHLIGQIQTNKVKYIKRDVVLIHSLDRLHLAQALNARGQAEERTFDVLIEANLGGEQTKTGVPEDRIDELVMSVAGLSNLRVRGFMTMAPLGTDDESSRPYFGALARIFDRYKSFDAENFDLKYLSMGMTHDYYGAVLEGANIVRIGSAIFKEQIIN